MNAFSIFNLKSGSSFNYLHNLPAHLKVKLVTKKALAKRQGLNKSQINLNFLNQYSKFFMASISWPW